MSSPQASHGRLLIPGLNRASDFGAVSSWYLPMTYVGRRTRCLRLRYKPGKLALWISTKTGPLRALLICLVVFAEGTHHTLHVMYNCGNHVRASTLSIDISSLRAIGGSDV
jgi:hypothetical protein